MSEMGLKEKALVATVGVVVLYLIAAAIWFLDSQKAWTKAARQYGTMEKRYEREEALIAEKSAWDDRYEAEKAAMPTFEFGKDTETTWRRSLDSIALTNHVLITDIDAGDEVAADDVLELPITIGNVEGSLESLVKFLHEIENTDKGMFDIKAINLSPNKSKPGYLKGDLSLTCAYMRED